MAERGRWSRGRVAAGVFLAFFFSACNGGARTALPSGGGVPSIPATVPDRAPFRLFVASGHSVGVYKRNGELYTQLGEASIDERSLLVTKGRILVGQPQGSLITVYALGLKTLQTLQVKNPIAMVQDRNGNLYVLGLGVVSVFAPGSSLPYGSAPFRTITSGVESATDIAVDDNGTLYVANFRNGSSPGTNVAVYAANHNKPTRTITDGIAYPYTLALDSSNNLYVGNGGNDSVTVYAARKLMLTHTITDDMYQPYALAFDGKTLYVASFPSGCCPKVTAYKGNEFALVRTIEAGLDEPDGIAVDKKHDVYVANFGSSSVGVYGPKSDVPEAIITKDVEYPTAVAVQE
jgi:sugar lactone lactonase YvrE